MLVTISTTMQQPTMSRTSIRGDATGTPTSVIVDAMMTPTSIIGRDYILVNIDRCNNPNRVILFEGNVADMTNHRLSVRFLPLVMYTGETEVETM